LRCHIQTPALGGYINQYNYLQLEPIKYPLLNKFYALEKAKSKASSHDIVWITKHLDIIIAAARLAPLPGNYRLLTGVYVAVDYRSQGIARRLVSQCCLNQESIYTFALSPLEAFYQQLGFTTLTASDLPCELAQRFNAYVKQGRKIVAMIKQ